MSTITDFVKGAGLPAIGSGRCYRLHNVLDFSQKGAVLNDLVEVFNIPAGSFVHKVRVKVTTAQGATCTAKVGDAADDDAFIASANLNSTATDTVGAGTEEAAAGKFYPAAAEIILKPGHTVNAAVVEVTAFVYEL